MPSVPWGEKVINGKDGGGKTIVTPSGQNQGLSLEKNQGTNNTMHSQFVT
jgi:hypothetical protein